MVTGKGAKVALSVVKAFNELIIFSLEFGMNLIHKATFLRKRSTFISMVSVTLLLLHRNTSWMVAPPGVSSVIKQVVELVKWPEFEIELAQMSTLTSKCLESLVGVVSQEGLIVFILLSGPDQLGLVSRDERHAKQSPKSTSTWPSELAKPSSLPATDKRNLHANSNGMTSNYQNYFTQVDKASQYRFCDK